MYAERVTVSDSAHGQGLPVSIPASIPNQHISAANKHDKSQDQLLEGPNISKSKSSKAAYYATDYIAGLLGGCAGLVFGHPFDTVKVRQQTSGGSSVNVIKCTSNTYRCGGISAFYKGLAFPLVAEGFRNMIFFGVYGSTMKFLYCEDGKTETSKPRYVDIALAGAVGGAMQAIPAVPIELVKVKLQTQMGRSGDAGVTLGTERIYKGPVDCIRSIYRNHGMRGTFRGITPTVIRDTTGFATYISTYEFLCNLLAKEGSTDCSVASLLLAGGIAGTCSWIINIPMDVVKSRMQFDSLKNPKYKSTLDCAIDSYKREGVTVFWRGLPVTCLRAFPVNAVTFAVYSLSLRSMERVLHVS